jgi:toxin ParE1/3/4
VTKKRVVNRLSARRDVKQLLEWINKDSPAAAVALAERLKSKLQTLQNHPEIGPSQPEIAPDARLLSLRPFIILYRISGDQIEIVRVLHGARNVTPELFAEGLLP